MDLKPHCLQNPPSVSSPRLRSSFSFNLIFFPVKLFKIILSTLARLFLFFTPARLPSDVPAVTFCLKTGRSASSVGELKAARIGGERRDQRLLPSVCFCCSYYCRPSLEDFAHCKDEMDVIIVHCGFRLCAVKLWTVNVRGVPMGHESVGEPVGGYHACPGSFRPLCKFDF